MRELIFNYIKNQELIKYNESDIATNRLKLDGKNVELSGNQLGLIMLADYLVEIALSKDKTKHIHLDINNFFDEIDGELIISKEE